MTSITIRKLDEELAQRLCIRAAKHGCSMEEEARNILRAALEHETAPTEALGTALHAIFKPFGGVTLEIPPESRCANRRASQSLGKGGAYRFLER